jgi:hypothetical protein
LTKSVLFFIKPHEREDSEGKNIMTLKYVKRKYEKGNMGVTEWNVAFISAEKNKEIMYVCFLHAK